MDKYNQPRPHPPATVALSIGNKHCKCYISLHLDTSDTYFTFPLGQSPVLQQTLCQTLV